MVVADIAPPAIGEFPLTELQEAYLVGATPAVELGGVRPTYYVELDVVDLDVSRAERAIEVLLARHEHLRTEILPEGRHRVWATGATPRVRLPVVDLTEASPRRQRAAILRTRRRLCEEGIEPTGWPLFEVVVHRLRPNRARVHVAMSLLLLDGHGIRQVRDEWLALYADPASMDAHESGPPAASFRECRLAQLSYEDTEEYEAHWRYWDARLDTLPEAPRLPLARPLRSIGSPRFARRTLQLPPDRWQALCANARRHRLMPTAALLHLFAETLGAWAASPRFCLNVLHQGWQIAHPEWAGVVGQFGATLPVEVHDTGDFWDRGRALQSQLWRDLEHGQVSGVRIAREVALRQGRSPHANMPFVFTSMLAAGGTPLQTGSARTVPARPVCRVVHSGLRTPQVLIDNQVMEADQGLTCVWDSVDDAFPPGLPDLMFAAYRSMVGSLAEPGGLRGALQPVSQAHRGQVAAVNDTVGPVPAGRLEDGFLRRARTHPGAIALVTSSGEMTYRELGARSAMLAARLRSQGVGRGDIVPIVMAKGWEQVVAVLAVLRAGAAYCPIDAALPLDRIRALADECSVRLVLGQPGRTPDLGPPFAVCPVDAEEAATARLPRRTVGEATDLAYVVHTSGSTGRPKGVAVEHRSALNTVHDVNRRIGLRPGDRVFGISSLSFDLSVWDILGTLTAGATLVVPEATTRPDPVGWLTAAPACTVWNSVPALAEMLVEVLEQRLDLARPPIRTFLLSGDWIPVTLPDRLRATWPGVRVTAMGGATEAAIWSNVYEVGKVDPSWRSIPYGTPLRNQTMTVLDERLEVRAPWAEGDIHIGGIGLARGYLHDELRTAERFITHPRTGERLYRTGDRGRYWPDGTIEFLGRVDRQLKIQGFRVEPAEVEAALASHPAVQVSVVGADSAPTGQRRLVGLVVPRAGARPDAATLVAHLRDRLPAHLVPARIDVVDRLPLTSNGKVDLTRALAAITPARPARRRGRGGRADAMTRHLCRVLASLVGVDEAGPDDDFFALGGTSLLALRLVNRLRQDMGVDLPLGQVFETPTARRLAARIKDGRDHAPAAVTLHEREGPALFLFHPVGGSVGGYRALARAWPGVVRGFQSRGLVTGVVSDEPDLAALAASYRAELTRLGPTAACVLGGWSMGGVLAHEVGAQLARLGQSCHVFMLDSEVPEPAPPTGPADRTLDFLRDLARGDLPIGLAEGLRDAAASDLDVLSRDLAVRYDLLPPTTDVATFTGLAAVYAHNADLLARHTPGVSAAPTLMFVAGRRPGSQGRESAWRVACPELAVEVLPDDHYSIASEGRAGFIVNRVLSWRARTGKG